ncbi:MAG: hypothetical protein Tsb0020_27250 [Haliangiales bacterium]
MPISEVTFVGLQNLHPEQVWALVGGRPAGTALGGEQAALLLVRLSQSGLFADIVPTVTLHERGGATVVVLEVTLREHPRVKHIVVQGLDELPFDELVDVVLETPPARKRKRDRDRDDDDARCPTPHPPSDWLARDGDGDITEGVLWRGLEPAMERLSRYLLRKGYHLASFSAALTPDGTLVIAIDEGRIRTVRIAGVSEALEPRVQQLLGLTPGAIFLEADLEAGMARVRREFPFLRSRRGRRPTRGAPKIVVEHDDAGGARAYAMETQCPTSRGKHRRVSRWYSDGDISADVDAQINADVHSDIGANIDANIDAAIAAGDGSWPGTVRDAIRIAIQAGIEGTDFRLVGAADGWAYSTMCGRRSYQLVDGDVIVHFRARRGDLDVSAVELLRHTPVTGYAPGLEIATTLWDSSDRAHLTIRSEFNLNTGRLGDNAEPGEDLVTPIGDSDLLLRLSTQERVDWGLGASLEIPRMSLAELGFEVHNRVDTADRWRLGRIDSYLNSMVLNRPEADYFRRTGGSLFATLAPSRGFLLGAEYRYDRYDSMTSLEEPYTWFRRDEPGYASPAIDAGVMGSALLRLEWASGGLARKRRVESGALRRHPETSLLGGRVKEPRHSGLHTMNTLEFTRPSLGGDEQFDFTRLISDNRLYLATGRSHGLSLRARAEFGKGVPLQKRAALGGWGSVRGYGFKELTGDATLLLGAEYNLGVLSAFVDLGAVRNDDSWETESPGVGAAFHFGDVAELTLAWRTDDNADATPAVRLLFERPF